MICDMPGSPLLPEIFLNLFHIMLYSNQNEPILNNIILFMEESLNNIVSTLFQGI